MSFVILVTQEEVEPDVLFEDELCIRYHVDSTIYILVHVDLIRHRFFDINGLDLLIFHFIIFVLIAVSCQFLSTVFFRSICFLGGDLSLSLLVFLHLQRLFQ